MNKERTVHKHKHSAKTQEHHRKLFSPQWYITGSLTYSPKLWTCSCVAVREHYTTDHSYSKTKSPLSPHASRLPPDALNPFLYHFLSTQGGVRKGQHGVTRVCVKTRRQARAKCMFLCMTHNTVIQCSHF